MSNSKRLFACNLSCGQIGRTFCKSRSCCCLAYLGLKLARESFTDKSTFCFAQNTCKTNSHPVQLVTKICTSTYQSRVKNCYPFFCVKCCVAFRYNPFTTKVCAKQDLVGKETQCKGSQRQHLHSYLVCFCAKQDLVMLLTCNHSLTEDRT